MRQNRGFTIIELLLTVAILSIVLAVAVPSMSAYMEKRRIINAAEAVYSEMQYTRSEAIARSQTVYTSFNSNATDTWSIGVSTTTGCDPTETVLTEADACVLVIDDGDGNIHGTDPDGDGTAVVDNDDLVMRVTSSTDFPGVIMGDTSDPMDQVTFGAATQAAFDPTRGVVAAGGTVALRLNKRGGGSYEMRVILSPIGRVRICSPAGDTRVAGYTTC